MFTYHDVCIDCYFLWGCRSISWCQMNLSVFFFSHGHSPLLHSDPSLESFMEGWGTCLGDDRMACQNASSIGPQISVCSAWSHTGFKAKNCQIINEALLKSIVQATNLHNMAIYRHIYIYIYTHRSTCSWYDVY